MLPYRSGTAAALDKGDNAFGIKIRESMQLDGCQGHTKA